MKTEEAVLFHACHLPGNSVCGLVSPEPAKGQSPMEDYMLRIVKKIPPKAGLSREMWAEVK